MSDASSSTTTARSVVSQKTHEFGVAALVIGEHPATFTESELIRHICRGRPEESGRVFEAIRELIASGVLLLEGERIYPSEAAVSLARVWDMP